MKRRRFLHLAAGAAALPALLPLAWALDYPTRPVRIVVPYPAGIAPDIVARVVAQALSQRLKQQFIVDNRPGGASNVGTAMVAHAAPDGYTLLVVTTTNAINASLYDNLDFDLIRDIAPVAGLVRLGLVIVVHPSVPAQTLGEFIAYAKANPGKINYASVGSGAATNVAGELFKAMAGVNLVNVPYRGSYLPDLISGQVQASFTPILQSLGYIKAGKLRALAVTGATRSASLPDVPAAVEFVPGYQAYVWDAVGAPAKTPEEIVEQLNKEINAVLLDPAIKACWWPLRSRRAFLAPRTCDQMQRRSLDTPTQRRATLARTRAAWQDTELAGISQQACRHLGHARFALRSGHGRACLGMSVSINSGHHRANQSAHERGCVGSAASRGRGCFWFQSPAFHFASGQISGTSLPLCVQGSTVHSSLVLRSLITAVLCGPSVNKNRDTGAAIVWCRSNLSWSRTSSSEFVLLVVSMQSN